MMRLAFVSPMPPSASGIADYSAALVAELERLADVSVISERPAKFDPSHFDLILYQIGNNPSHAFAYEMALQHPGVVALHEPNLHHLIAELTIKRGDWDAYEREAAYEGGEVARAHAGRVRALEAGPDYERVPMTKRLLDRSRGVIVHSGFAAGEIRRAGFAGPVARIPHGAWTPAVERMAWRQKLGLDESTPLVGIFGHLKPYKRIAESLRAFRRLLRVEPRAKMILVGEPHPDFPAASLIRTLDLSPSARVLGFVPPEAFTGYMAACDVVLNLRYPTVGESSGTLMRALGLGKCVLVSDVGSFRELPDDVCVKAPVDAAEEDVIFESLNLLLARPGAAAVMGARARRWVEEECRWDVVAKRYAGFLESLLRGEEWSEPAPRSSRPVIPVAAEEVLAWTAPEPGSEEYVGTHLTRIEKTLSITPKGEREDRILEMGAYLQMTPLLGTKLGYGEVRGCYFGPAGQVEHKTVTSAEGERFECAIDLFDAERDPFPYPDGHFTTVLCCELLEHLAADPMRMMAEINRVLKPGGSLVLTTPNQASLRAISSLLLGYHPSLFSVYLRPDGGAAGEERHQREYTPLEIHLLLTNSGFDVAQLETGPFREAPRPELAWVTHLLETYRLPTHLRGEGIYAVGRKAGPVRERYPDWLYWRPGQ
jgi:glycosyltransferase involved in cell wall biosynthesis